MFTLKIDNSNSAFENNTELINIIQHAIEKLKQGETEGNLKDINGNTVGAFKLTNINTNETDLDESYSDNPLDY